MSFVHNNLFQIGTDGWFCVAKGKIRLFSLCYCWRAIFLSSKFTSESVFYKNLWVTSLLEAFSEVFDHPFKQCLDEIVFNSLLSLSFNETSFDTGWVAEGIKGAFDSFDSPSAVVSNLL